MSRSTYDVKETYTGDGSLAAYTFDFLITDKSQLEIIEVNDSGVETQRVRGTDTTYLSSVVFDNIDGGGTVTLAANLTTNYKLIILLANDEPTQSYEFRNKTSFTLKRFENAIDELAGPVQRLTYRGKQSLRIHDLDDEETFNAQLPPNISSNVDKVLKINAGGTGFEFGPTSTDIANAQTNAAAAASSATDAQTAQTAAEAAQAAAEAAEAKNIIIEDCDSTRTIDDDTDVAEGDTSGADRVLTLPDPSTRQKPLTIVHKTSGNKLTLSGTNIKLTNGETSNTIESYTQGDVIELYPDGSNWVASKRGIYSRVYARCTSTPISANITTQTVNFNDEQEDTFGGFVNTTGRFVPAAGTSGRYLFKVRDTTETSSGQWGANDYLEQKLRIGGTTATTGGTVYIVNQNYYQGTVASTTSGTGKYLEAEGSWDIFVPEGETVDLNKYHNASTTANTAYADIQITRIGDR